MTKLEEARDLIGVESRWCQNALARNKYGHITISSDKEAVSWCAMGAMIKVCEYKNRPERVPERIPGWACLYRAGESLYNKTIGQVNDELGHEAVMKMYERAIEYEKEQTISKENHEEERAPETTS